jgi:hypothetical protein
MSEAIERHPIAQSLSRGFPNLIYCLSESMDYFRGMGMFDYLRCKMPLPSEPAPPSAEWFQTKDVPTHQLYMERWTIEADGRLIKHGVRYEDRSDPNAEGFLRWLGCMTAVLVPEEDKVVDFHGDIGFGHFDYETKEDWDYVARFTEGRCTKIWCDEHLPPIAEAAQAASSCTSGASVCDEDAPLSAER